MRAFFFNAPDGIAYPRILLIDHAMRIKLIATARNARQFLAASMMGPLPSLQSGAARDSRRF
jgi:hypothetical protein